MSTTKKDYSTWINPMIRKNLIERLRKDIKKINKANQIENVKDIFLGAITDSYQPLEAEHKQTRQVIEVLIENKLPFTILTKSALVLRDVDLFKKYKWCRVGTTITSLDEAFRVELEPFTASYQERIHVLETLKANKISTYLSCEPTMPTPESDLSAIVQKLEGIVDLFDFGMYSNKGDFDYTPKQYLKHYGEDKFYLDIFSKAIQYCIENRINYCISSHSKPFFKKHNLPFKPYPLLKPKPNIAQTILTDFLASSATIN
jgi:DNA repair photolyase